MDTHPLVSVIIPTYNAEPWILDTLNSALAQTYPSMEIIVVDDCSKDKTRAILASFGNRIRVIENKINKGVSVARNSAIEVSRGKYIAFLDHDDLWHPDKLEKQMALFEANPNLGLVYSDAYYEKANHNRWNSFQIDPPFRGKAFEKLLEHNFILCLTVVIPRHILKQIGWFNSDLHYAEDYDLFLRISERFPIDFIEEPLATYRVHSQNFSYRTDICYPELIQILLSYRSRARVNGSIAMAYIQWGKTAWRADRRYFRGLVQVLKGFLLALRDPIGFFKAIH